ncbi:hypothetical protein VNO77_01462 [Canavalia gladiata]|uniref:Uncharacterized protein n=1 Tax=Canavalia gladiata TaxID=3824 RepID=A0AAN9MRW8_CANGL
MLPLTFQHSPTNTARNIASLGHSASFMMIGVAPSTVTKFPPFVSQPLLFSGDVETFHVLRFTSFLRGYNIGIRLIDEFLAKSYVSRCVDFKETACNCKGIVLFLLYRSLSSDYALILTLICVV